MTVRILAIEDDLLHAEALKLEIEALDHILIDVVDNAEDFRRLIKATVPDLLIIDIDLGEEVDGVALAQEVTKNDDIPFLFLTAQEETKDVQRATEVSPNAYLTKPVNRASLQAAINLAIQKIDFKKPQFKPESQLFLLKDDEGLKPVDLDELVYVEANNKSCILQLKNEKRETTMKLSALSERLPADDFMQIHRSFIIRVDKIEMVDPAYLYLTVRKVKIPIGRKYKEALMQKLLKIG